MDTTDADLLEQWRNGNEDAGKELRERYHPMLHGFFAKVLSTDVNVEDLVQDTFRRCVEGCDWLKDTDEFYSCLLSIARNLLRGHASVLLKQWRNGNQDAGKELFELYYPMLDRFFANKVSNKAPNTIGDLVQDTFWRCVKGRDRIKDTSKFRSYLFSIAYNVLRDCYRKQERHEPTVDLDKISVASVAPGPYSIIVKRQEERLLLEALRNISIKNQCALELYYWESLSVSEVAEILEINYDKARSRLYRARERLGAKIKELASSEKVLKSTTDDFDKWIKRCRDALDLKEPPIP